MNGNDLKLKKKKKFTLNVECTKVQCTKVGHTMQVTKGWEPSIKS